MTEKEKMQICEIILSRKQQDGSSGGPPLAKKCPTSFPAFQGQTLNYVFV